MEEAQNPVQGVKTSIRILRALKLLNGANLQELADRLDLSKGAVHNHLSTLEEQRFVVKEDNTYELGLEFTIFGEYVRNHSQLYQVARPEIIKMAEKTGEYAHLTVEQHGLGMKLFKHQGEDAVGYEYQIAKLQKSECLHYTATGKAILAHLPQGHVDDIVDYYGLPKRTAKTITNRKELYDELSTIRERGYSCNDEEEVEGIRAIGAPVVDHTGTVLGAISISSPMARMNDEQFHHRIPEIVTNATNVIEANLNMHDRKNQFEEF